MPPKGGTRHDTPLCIDLRKRKSALTRDSIINVSRRLTLDRAFLTERAGRLSDKALAQGEDGMRPVLRL